MEHTPPLSSSQSSGTMQNDDLMNISTELLPETRILTHPPRLSEKQKTTKSQFTRANGELDRESAYFSMTDEQMDSTDTTTTVSPCSTKPDMLSG